MYSKSANTLRFASVGDSVEIGQHLSVTPAQIAIMAEKGIPINSANVESQFFDGGDYTFNDFDSTDIRGVDISDIWNAEQESRKNVRRLSKLQEKAKSLEKSLMVKSEPTQ